MKTYVARRTMNMGISFSRIRTQIMQRLNQYPAALGSGKRLKNDNVLFVQNAAVNYQPGSDVNNYSVRQEDLVTVEQFSQAFGEMLSGGPWWVHANLIPFDDNTFLITLCAGAKVRNPRFSLNLSFEPNKMVEIISTKTLVTTS